MLNMKILNKHSKKDYFNANYIGTIFFTVILLRYALINVAQFRDFIHPVNQTYFLYETTFTISTSYFFIISAGF
jgi:hypothetical protein